MKARCTTTSSSQYSAPRPALTFYSRTTFLLAKNDPAVKCWFVYRREMCGTAELAWGGASLLFIVIVRH